MPSAIPAAWEVLPLASRVEKQWVSFLLGRSLMNMEISTSLINLPSSERSFSAVSSVITYSLPSPWIWLYTPASSAFNRVDLPWYPPPAMRVMPTGIPIPVMVPLWGSCISTRREAGEENGTLFFIGFWETPLCLGRMALSATKAARLRFFNSLRMYAWSSARKIAASTSFGFKFL